MRRGCRDWGFEGTNINADTEPSAKGEARTGLRLDLFLEPGERLEGHVTVVGEAVPVPFQGWVEFMAAVDTLRGRHGRRGDITVPVTGRTTEPAHRTRRRRQG